MVSIRNILKVLGGAVAETPTQFVEWLENQIKSRGLSKSELARKAKLGRSTITETLQGKRPGIDVCKALAAALELDETIVLREAGHVTRRPNDYPANIAEAVGILFDLPTDEVDEFVQNLRLRRERLKRGKRVKAVGSNT